MGRLIASVGGVISGGEMLGKRLRIGNKVVGRGGNILLILGGLRIGNKVVGRGGNILLILGGLRSVSPGML